MTGAGVAIAYAVILAAIVAAIAWRVRALTADGALAAWAVGAATFAAGGWSFAAVLFAFFIPAIVLSRIGRTRKAALVETAGKHGPRDARQVLANGGVAALAAIAFAITHSFVAAAAFAGAFAAAAADTFGTEIGTLARNAPRSILNARHVARGLSGGVTLIGTAAEAAGALLAGIVTWALGLSAWWMVAAAGFAGALADSLLGGSAQALYYCARCERFCEFDPHSCGTQPKLVRGLRVIDNDAVNALATSCGALVAALLAFYIAAR